jgi:hypothetical protein
MIIFTFLLYNLSIGSFFTGLFMIFWFLKFFENNTWMKGFELFLRDEVSQFLIIFTLAPFVIFYIIGLFSKPVRPNKDKSAK